jgi:enoyl-CoA hydratase/carnithine racemase
MPCSIRRGGAYGATADHLEPDAQTSHCQGARCSRCQRHGLATAADLTIAAENAKFGLTAVKVGLNCVGPVIPVARCIGRKRALELLLYGELIKAPQAMAMGLVNRVVPAEQLADDTLQWARLLAEKSPLAVQIAKSAFYNAEDLPYEKAFNYMNEAFARLCTTADAREGIAAFFERRNPVWQQK